MSPPPSTPKIPTISISPFLSPSTPHSTLLSTASLLSSACVSPGFFYLTNHNLPSSLTDRVLALARDFFTTVSDAEKRTIKRRAVGEENGDGARGYQIRGENITEGKRDWCEGIDWYRPIVAGEPFSSSNPSTRTPQSSTEEKNRAPPFALLQGLNQWPSQPPNFREVYEDYVAKMLELGMAVVRAMGMALKEEGVLQDEQTFVKETREAFWVMRAIGYPPLLAGEEEDDVGVSCGAHTDYGCVTLLLADATKGALQVWLPPATTTTTTTVSSDSRAEYNDDHGRWINVDPLEGALVVNIGDMMARWSKGRWKSTRHRVVHRGGGMRVSVPFFFEPDFGARVPGLGDGEEVVYGEYLAGKVGGNF